MSFFKYSKLCILSDLGPDDVPLPHLPHDNLNFEAAMNDVMNQINDLADDPIADEVDIIFE